MARATAWTLFWLTAVSLAIGYNLLWLLAVLAAFFIVWVIVKGASAAQAEDDQAVSARADEQHRLWLDGNVRGLYGEYTPKGEAR